MRTIKFRGRCAKDSKYAGEWVYGSCVQCEKSDDVLIVSAITDSCSCTYHVDPDTVGQFTGLHDVNGKEIYEGDIIQHRDVKVIVEFYRGAFGYTRLIQHRVRIAPGASNVVQEHVFIPFIGSDDNKNALQFPDGTYFDTDFCKVIGHSRRNPELIKKGGNDEHQP